MTRDIDVVIELRAEDVDSLENAFKETYMVDKASVLRALGGAPRIFNIIIRKDSPYRQEEFERRTYEDFFGTSVAVVAPEDLVLSKLDWAIDSRSEIQLGDVKSLLSNVSDLDTSYIDRWAA